MSPEAARRARRILIVEDEFLVALGVSGLIEEMGHAVCGVAGSVAEALELSRAHQPDLVLMDVNLQEGGSGIDAAHQLRAFERPPLVLFVTSYVDSDTRRRMEEAAPYGIVQKPFQEAHLQRTVEQALSTAGGSEPDA
jgi:CheY-like chemotaxis protein